MNKILFGVLLAIVCLAVGSARAGAPSLELPPVFLVDLPIAVSVTDASDRPLTVLVDGESVFEGIAEDGQVLAEVKLSAFGHTDIELQQQGATLEQWQIPVIPAWASLLPPLLESSDGGGFCTVVAAC